jgi:DnaK suppressor protein
MKKKKAAVKKKATAGKKKAAVKKKRSSRKAASGKKRAPSRVAKPGKKPSSKKKAPSRKKLTRKELQHYRDKLLNLRSSIIESMTHYQKAALYHSQRDSSGDLSGYGIHQADSATDSYEIDFSLGLATNNQELIHEIDEALERVKDGTYGFSELDGRFIGKKRLNAVPYARFTKEEQEEFEKKRRAGF